jgi:hypothetical protein
MKTILLLGILLIMSTLTFGQSEKSVKCIKDIIAAVNLQLPAQITNPTKAYFKLKSSYALEDIKMACDSIMKSRPTGWILNLDKNEEKQYLVDGKKLLITIYWKDEFIYFEY